MMRFEVVGIWVRYGVTKQGTPYFSIVASNGATLRFWLREGVGIESPPPFGSKVRVSGTGFPAKSAIQVEQVTIALDE